MEGEERFGQIDNVFLEKENASIESTNEECVIAHYMLQKIK